MRCTIVDGKNLLWRNADAFSDLTAHVDGEEMRTGGMYGFVSGLLRIRSKYRGPVIVAWEGTDKASNFRIKLWPEYKRKRVEDATEAQEELSREVAASEGRLNELLSHAGVRQFYGIACEADDVIATLAVALQRKGHEVTIYTGDSDLRQLARTGITVAAPGFRSGGDKLYDYHAVVERYGVRPRQLATLKALAGDSSDGIPGLPGIGEKTAAQLVATFGHLDGVIAHARGADVHADMAERWPVAARFRDIVKAGADKAELFLKLTTVKTDVRLKRVPVVFDRDEVVRLLRAYKFRSLSSAAELLEVLRLGHD
jgi:DNA polymerase-1